MFIGIVALVSTAALAQDADEDGCVDSYYDANGACVATNASIGPDTTIGAGAFIGERSTLVGRSGLSGNRPVGAGTVIGRRVYIDADHTIGADNTIGRAVTAGARLQTEASATLGYGSVLGDDVFVGNGAAAGSLVTLGNHTRLEPGAVLARGVTIADSDSSASIAGIIGPDVTVGSGFTMSSGSRIRKGAQLGNDVTLNGTARVGRDALIGDGAVLGNGARVAAGAEVTANTHVPEGLIVRRGDVYDDPVVSNIHNTVSFNPTTTPYQCTYNNESFRYQNIGQMDWKSCMVAAAERGASVTSNVYTDVGQGSTSGWTPHRVGSVAMHAGTYSSYQTSPVSTTRACVLSKDPSIPNVTTTLTETAVHQGETWHYANYGQQYYDQCLELAAEAGASIISPQTIGLTGNNYWTPSQHTCNVYNWTNSSGSPLGYNTASAWTRSGVRQCMVGYIADPGN